MIRYMIWVQTDNCEGWGCSVCSWLVASPQPESTVAALEYNRAAQRTFDAHECQQNGNGGKKPSGGIGYMRSRQAGCF